MLQQYRVRQQLQLSAGYLLEQYPHFSKSSGSARRVPVIKMLCMFVAYTRNNYLPVFSEFFASVDGDEYRRNLARLLQAFTRYVPLRGTVSQRYIVAGMATFLVSWSLFLPHSP